MDEFRRAMPTDEYARIIQAMFDDNEEPPPKGSDAFNCNDVPDTALVLSLLRLWMT